MDRFIEKYLAAMGPISDDARETALAEIRAFLEESSQSDFHSADDFADQLFDKVSEAYKEILDSKESKTKVKRLTKEFYRHYRLEDETPIPEGVSVTLRFGAPDTRAVNFFNSLDNFYFSTFVDNSKQEIKDFLRSEYLEKGAALFGRETAESIDDFRKAAGDKLANMNDRAVSTVIHSSVQRIRNYAHINSLRQAKVEQARIRVIEDGRCTTEICPTMDGKIVNVSVAAEAVDRLTDLAPGDYALELFKSEQGKAFSSDPVGYVQDRVGDDDVVDDDLIAEGRGFPPFHPRCRCWLEGVVPGSAQE